MDRAALRIRARDLDSRLQALAGEYEALWEDLQAALDAGNAYLDPDLTIGNRLMGLASGIPHLGRVFGAEDAPPRAVYVVTSDPGDAPWVEAVFLSEAPARAWVSRQAWPKLYDIEIHALGYPQLTEELRRRKRAPSPADEARAAAADPADVAEARRVRQEMDALSEAPDEEQQLLGELVFEGVMYVRPVGRGVTLEDTGDELDEAIGRVVERAIGRDVSGDRVRARMRLEVLSDEGSAAAPRLPGAGPGEPSDGGS